VIKNDKFTLTPYALWERVTIKNGENNPAMVLPGLIERGGTLTAGGGPDPIAGYQLLVGGLNMRIYENFGVKLEYSYLSVYTAGAFAGFKGLMDAPSVTAQFNIGF
jgi:hypothetical protein